MSPSVITGYSSRTPRVRQPLVMRGDLGYTYTYVYLIHGAPEVRFEMHYSFYTRDPNQDIGTVISVIKILQGGYVYIYIH